MHLIVIDEQKAEQLITSEQKKKYIEKKLWLTDCVLCACQPADVLFIFFSAQNVSRSETRQLVAMHYK